MSLIDPASLPVVFLSFANDPENPLPAVAGEYQALEKCFRQPDAQRICRVVTAPYATTDNIIAAFLDRANAGRIAVFHFAGHTDDAQLLLQNWAGERTRVNAGGLAAFLGCQPGLRLVFLNGCANVGQVQALLDAGVAVVVATSAHVEDTLAAAFAEHFYCCLASGDTIELAFRRAEAAVQLGTPPDSDAAQNLTARDPADPDTWPWRCYTRPGAELALRWSLPEAANDPLFGLPELAPGYYDKLPDSPFRGLTWFPAEYAALFFGRGHQIRELYAHIASPFDPLLLLLYGQSGVGKSSLLAAGLAPRLADSHTLVYLRYDPAVGLAGALYGVFPSARPGESLYAAWSAAEAEQGQPLVVVLDQIEEVFTRPPAEHVPDLAAFLAALQPAALPAGPRLRGRLVLGFRKEWLAEIKRKVAEAGLPAVEMFLQRLDRRGVIEAITGPAATPQLQARYHLTVAADLPGRLADDLLDDPGSAVGPMLQMMLTLLWDRARARNYAAPQIDQALYQELLRDEPGLARTGGDKHMPTLYAVLGHLLVKLEQRQPEAVVSGLALDLLTYHTTPLGTAEQRTASALKATYASHAEALPALLAACRDLYLLIDPAENDPAAEPASRLTHDTLAPQVQLRFDESVAPGQRARRILAGRSGAWTNGNTGVTLDEPDLLLVERGQDGMRDWTPDEVRLIEASRAERERRRRQARRLRRLKRSAIAAMAVVVALVALQQAWRLYRDHYLDNSRWQPLAGRNFPADADVYAVDYSRDPASPTGYLYCVGTWTVGVGCSRDGKTWNFYQQGLPTGECDALGIGAWCGNGKGITALTFDAVDSHRLYLFSEDGHIYRSNTGGQYWLASTMVATATEVTTIAAQGEVVVAVARRFLEPGDERLYVSTDAGRQFSLAIAPHDPQFGPVYDAVLLPASDTILLATATGLWLGARNGASWHWTRDDTAVDAHGPCTVPVAAEPRLLALAPGNTQLAVIVFYAPGTQQSTLALRSAEGIRCVAAWSGEPRRLTVDPRLTALPSMSSTAAPLAAVLLMDNSVVRAVAPGRVAHWEGLSHWILGYPYDLEVVPQPGRRGVWLLLGHRRGVMNYVSDPDSSS